VDKYLCLKFYNSFCLKLLNYAAFDIQHNSSLINGLTRIRADAHV
jgi:hypothetical protein